MSRKVVLADLDGDGVLDIVASAPMADVRFLMSVVVDAGSIHLWRGQLFLQYLVLLDEVFGRVSGGSDFLCDVTPPA